MTIITLKGLWAHKRRLVATFLAVSLGVSFLSGTLVLGDTMRATFATIFESVNAGIDVQVAADTFESDVATQQHLIEAATLDRVRAVDGVQRAEPVVTGYGRIIGSDGRPVGGNGPPTVAGNWVDDPGLNPYRLADGRLPIAPDEVVVNRGALSAGHLAIGDRVTVQTPEPAEVTIVGASTFGDLDSSGGVTSTAFTLDGAQQHLLHGSTQLSSISIAARSGVAQTELAARIEPVLPAGVHAVTGEQLTARDTAAVNAEFLDFLTTFLLVFAGIALVVATFSIYNTFSIIVAQRARESALLRALGASRRQVLTSTVLEAGLVGAAAAVAGLVGGLAVATGLKAAFTAFGMDLPATGLTLRGSTVVWSLSIGIVLTVAAGFAPAVRAARIPPIAALRDLAIDRTAVSAARAIGGALVTAIGVAMVLVAVAADTSLLALAGLGSFLTILGVVVLGPVVAARASRVLGWPASRFRGVAGRLAQENGARNPRRTSATASALMIGVGVVTLFTVVAASLTASVSDSLGRSFGGDLVVTSDAGMGAGTFAPDLAHEIGALPEVATSVGIGDGVAQIAGDRVGFPVAELTQIDRVVDLDVLQGDPGDATGESLAVSRTEADARKWALDDDVPVTFVDGSTVAFRIAAVYADSDVMGSLIMNREGWTPHASQDLDTTVLVGLADGVSVADGRSAVEEVARGYAGAAVQDRDQYVEMVGAGVNQVLALVYVMLALAILIALMGITNTLSLSIHERTRELGLLRAVGQTRSQIRSMVRWESVVMALFGTVGGVGLGVFLGWALVRASSGAGIGVFSVAPVPLAVISLVGAVAGVVAAIRPARVAARLDVLQALAAS